MRDVIRIAVWVVLLVPARGVSGEECPLLFAGPKYGTGNGPLYVAIGDLDSANGLDLAVANHFGVGTVSVLLNNGDGTFAAAVSYDVGTQPYAVEIGDLDGMNGPDLVVVNEFSDPPSVSVLLNNGDGTFEPEVAYSMGQTGHRSRSVAIADFDGTNGLDLAVANLAGGTMDVAVRLNLGDGTFGAASHYTAGDDPVVIASGDLDGRNFPDLVVANLESDNVSVLLNNGDGTFATAVNYGQLAGIGEEPWGVAIGDLDGMKGLDLVVGNENGHNVSVLLNDGSGDFTPAADSPYAVGLNPHFIAIGDLDGLNGPDIAVPNSENDTVSVLLNEGGGTGSFATAVTYGPLLRPRAVAIGDLDGVNGPELVVATQDTDAAAVLPNNGDGTFAAAAGYGAGSSPRSVAVGDLDGVDRADLVVANSADDTVSVLLNSGNGTFAPAVNSGVGTTPVSVAIGDLDAVNRPDLAVANSGSDTVSVLLNDGFGGFTLDSAPGVGGTQPVFVAIGDLDQGNLADLAVANAGDHTVSVLLNNGSGMFTLDDSYVVGTQPACVAIGDLDEANGPDLAVANSGTDNNVSVLLNDGSGGFTLDSSPGVGIQPVFVAIGDLDGANGPDLAVANAGSDNVSVLLSTGGGAFATAVNYDVGITPLSIVIENLDGVPGLDLAVANEDSHDVSVLLNDGSGTFAIGVAYVAGETPQSLAIGDLDGRHGPDLAVANLVTGAVTVVLSQCQPLLDPPVEVESAGPGDREDVGDFNNDGFVDVVIVIPDPNPTVDGIIQVFLNNGIDEQTGQWLELAPQTPVAAGSDPSGVTVGYFDADANLDVAVTNAGDDDVLIYLGNGDGTFVDPPTPFSTGGLRPSAIDAGEITEDGMIDLAVANEDSDTVVVLSGNGAGSFGVDQTLLSGGEAPAGLGVVYMEDKDDCLDVIGINRLTGLQTGPGPGSAFVMFNVAGALQPAVTFPVGVDPTDLTAGDFDHDGLTDIVVVNGADATATILINDGVGGFAAAPTLAVGAAPESVEAIDVDNDGDSDLAIVAIDPEFGPSVQVFLNEGVADGDVVLVSTGGYTLGAYTVGEDASPNFVVAADFNNDQEQDLVTVNDDADPLGTGGSVTVLLNSRTPCPADADFDRTVGVDDFLLVLALWGPCPDPCPADVDGDGVVGINDFLDVLASWGSCAP